LKECGKWAGREGRRDEERKRKELESGSFLLPIVELTLAASSLTWRDGASIDGQPSIERKEKAKRRAWKNGWTRAGTTGRRELSAKEVRRTRLFARVSPDRHLARQIDKKKRVQKCEGQVFTETYAESAYELSEAKIKCGYSLKLNRSRKQASTFLLFPTPTALSVGHLASLIST